MKKPILSVILPVHNTALYLEKCIKSILSQTFKDFELIIIDDGSQDNSPNIIKEFCKLDDRVRAFFQSNQGVSMARNLGIAEAKGEYITFVDSDDWINIDMYKNMIEKAIDNYDMIFCGYIREYLNKSEKEELLFENNTRLCNNDIFDQFILNLISNDRGNVIMGSTCRCIFKKSIILDNHIRFDNHVTYAEDLLFCIRYLLRCKKIYILSQHYYHYRYNIHSSLLKYDSNIWNKQLLLYQKIKCIFESHSKQKEIDRRLNIMIITGAFYSAFNILHRENKDNLFLKYKKINNIFNEEILRKAMQNLKKNESKYYRYSKLSNFSLFLLIFVKNNLNKFLGLN